ncbi:MAG: SET domain-containing protein [Chitinophagaceae bacterium]|nr:SET domain-containing protein [Chitinophagaceae bacterium]
MSQSAGYRLISHHGYAEVRRRLSNDQNALFVTRPFSTGELISDFTAGTIAAEPTYLTVQVGEQKHITLVPEHLQYINHSCEPNVFFDTSTMKLVALRDIKKDEELSFFYPSTEWEMTQSFQCYCGHASCLGTIKGAAFLNEEARKKYRFTDFIQHMLNKKRQLNKKVA